MEYQGLLKQRFYRLEWVRLNQDSSQTITRPVRMLQSPKKRIWPSCNSSSCANMRFQPPGDTKGKIPSKISTSDSASQNVSLMSKSYFLVAGAAGVVLPRMALKNSEDAGSSTMMSPFLLRLPL